MAYTEEWLTERAREAYLRGQAAFTVTPGRSALLVIELRKGFAQVATAEEITRLLTAG